MSAARASRRTRVLFAGTLALPMAGLALAGGSFAALGRFGLVVSLIWLALALLWAPLQRRAQVQGRLNLVMALGYGVDLAAVTAIAWRFGAAEFMDALGVFMVASMAVLYLPPRQLRWILAAGVACLCGLMLLPRVTGLAPPPDGPFQPHAWSPAVLAADIAILALVGLLGLAAWRSAMASAARNAELRHAAQRLRSLNEALHDQQFRLLVGQQDLLMANERLRLKSEEVIKGQDVVQALAQALEARDPYTQGHSQRVAETAVQLARELGLSGEDQDVVRHGCLLHDIGKINVPDQVLRKPGALDEMEFELMRRHPAVGEQICRPLALARPFLAIIRHHHERWDGGGYPDGLQGEEISLHARITAIADAWDAMTTDRPYRSALALPVAMRRLQEGAGTQWDPRLVRAFLGLIDRRLEESQGVERWPLKGEGA